MNITFGQYSDYLIEVEESRKYFWGDTWLIFVSLTVEELRILAFLIGICLNITFGQYFDSLIEAEGSQNLIKMVFDWYLLPLLKKELAIFGQYFDF